MKNFFEYCIYLIRKYPLARTLLFSVIFVSVLVVMRFLSKVQIDLPYIESLNPGVALPGEMISISGKGFGDERGSNYVEIGGMRITSQSYVSWKDEQIRIILPALVRSGQLAVVTGAGSSNKKVFASKDDMPLSVNDALSDAIPEIESFAGESGRVSEVKIGELLTIIGAKFGEKAENVFFSASTSETHDASGTFVAASEIEAWSENEIMVRVPDGAASGLIYVEVQNLQSKMQRIEVKAVGGSKRFYGKHIYVLEYACDVSDITMRRQTAKNTKDDAQNVILPPPVILHVPRPLVNARQPAAQLNDASNEPVQANTGEVGDVIVQNVDPELINRKKAVFSHTFVVNVYSLVTNIDENAIRLEYDKNKAHYQKYTQSDALIESETEDMVNFARTIVVNEKNPYKNARSIYKYLLDNFTFTENQRRSNAAMYSLLSSSRADSYDISLLYCALLRSLGIPARPIAGILTAIQESGSVYAQNHWWVEFYIEDFGWVPVDIALVLKTDKNDASLRSLCFGNLDARHIEFSAGLKTIENTAGYGKSVYRPRTFAFQSLWEESLPEVSRYTSFWSDIVISGVY